MTAIYTRFNPAKVGDVPMLLAKYRGREAEMLERLEAKYARVPVFVNGVQIFPAAPAPTPLPLPANFKPSTLLQQLAQPTLPPPLPPALAPEPIPSLLPTKPPPHQNMPSSWRPGMPLPSSSSFTQCQGQGQGQVQGQGQGQPADPFAGLTNLRR